jgi:hypothetical protein
MKKEIEKLYSQRTEKPMDVLITLTTSKVHLGYFDEADLPNVKQVQRKITKLRTTDCENEYQEVCNKLDSMTIELNEDPNKAITHGNKLGEGSDSDHLIINLTSRKWLDNIKHVSPRFNQEKYFCEQWLDSDFCNWQIFNSPQGFASTNNSIESFNSRIKKFFTKREKLSLSRTIDRLYDELITYYSVHTTEFKWFREPRAKDKKIALL